MVALTAEIQNRIFQNECMFFSFVSHISIVLNRRFGILEILDEKKANFLGSIFKNKIFSS